MISSKRRQWFTWVTLMLLSGSLGLYLRLYPITVFPQVKATHLAQYTVYANIRKAISKKIEASIPGAPQKTIDDMTSKNFKHMIKKDASEINNVIRKSAKAMLLQQKTSKVPNHLLGADPYYYLGQTEDILDKSYFDTKKDGRLYFNKRMLAPNGHWYPMDFHPWIGVVTHGVMSTLGLSRDLASSVRWVPFIIAILMIPICFFSGIKILKIGALGGFMTSAYMMVSPYFLKRSLVGWYDTDPYNVLFIFLITIALCNAFISKIKKSQFIYIYLSVAFACLYSLFWRGWMVPYAVILIISAVVSSFLMAWNKSCLSLIRNMQFFSYLIFLPLLWILIIWGTRGVYQEFAHTHEFVSSFFNTKFSPWPDVFVTVGELKSPGILKVAKLLGGGGVVLLALYGLLSASLRSFKNKSAYPVFIPIFFTLLFIVAIFVAAGTERLILLATVPVAIGIGFGICELIFLLIWLFNKTFTKAITKKYTLLPQLLSIAITICILLSSAKIGHTEIIGFHPIFNNTWQGMMEKLKKDTPEDSIVTTWWSPGHFLTSVAKRSVSWDGASQNEPRAYWIANLFMTNSEEMCLGILRMLNSSGTRSIDILIESGMSLPLSISIVKATLPLSADKAHHIFNKHLGKDMADKLILLTHPKIVPSSYLFLYNHMIEHALALEFIGLWDFSKAQSVSNLVNSHPDQIKSKYFKRASTDHIKLLWSLAGKPSQYEESVFENKRVREHVYFPNGVILNNATMDVRLDSTKYGKGRPAQVFYQERGEWIKKEYSDSNSDMAVYIISKQGTGPTVYQSVVLGKRLSESIAMRLYYYGALGMKHISSFAESIHFVDRTMLKAFEVDWDSFNK